MSSQGAALIYRDAIHAEVPFKAIPNGQIEAYDYVTPIREIIDN